MTTTRATAAAGTADAALLAADPSSRLQRAYDTIRTTRMAGIPIVNDALAVESVGFRAWQGFWLGVLVTPWCMNLALLPRDAAAWPSLRSGGTWRQRFPAGAFEFIAGREPLLGPGLAQQTLMCSLFSPMFEFADHGGARDTALACLVALFDSECAETDDLALGARPVTLAQDAAQAVARNLHDDAGHTHDGHEDAANDSAALTTPAPADTATRVSKRDFLRGRWSARESAHAAPAPTVEPQ